MEKKFTKAERRGKADNYEYADISYNIAECYRLRDDTNSSKWYQKCISTGKASFKACDRNKVTECNRTMGQIGISLYYLQHYEESIKYLEKAVGYSKNPDYNYFLGLANMRIEKYDIAAIEFQNFKITSTNIKDVENLLKICKDKLNNH